MDIARQDLKTIRTFTRPFRVERGKGFALEDFDPGDTLHLGSADKPRAQEALRKGVEYLAAMQDKLYAQVRGAGRQQVVYARGRGCRDHRRPLLARPRLSAGGRGQARGTRRGTGGAHRESERSASASTWWVSGKKS